MKTILIILLILAVLCAAIYALTWAYMIAWSIESFTDLGDRPLPKKGRRASAPDNINQC